MPVIPRIRYPDAQWLGNGGRYANGEGWGPLPDYSRGARWSQLRIVLHTTEGTGLPGYKNGTTAPHVTFDPRRGRIYQHNHFDRRVGTLINSTTAGALGNEISIQCEIICFSDRSLARRHNGLWVGDFKDDHYQMVADWVSWVTAVLGIPLRGAYGPSKDFAQFFAGKHATTRMSRSRWLNAGGILNAHGGAYGQDHWDTGALDIHRIYDLATGGAGMAVGIDFVKKGDGVDSGGGHRQRVRYWQRILRRLGVYPGALDGIYGSDMEEAVAQVTGTDGSEIGNKQAFIIHRKWVMSEAEVVVAQAIANLPSNPVEPTLVPHTHAVASSETGPARPT